MKKVLSQWRIVLLLGVTACTAYTISTPQLCFLQRRRPPQKFLSFLHNLHPKKIITGGTVQDSSFTFDLSLFREIVIMALIPLMLVGCSMVKNRQPTPTVSTTISQEEAIEIAVQIALQGGVEINPPSIKPYNARAELANLSEALKSLTGNDAIPVGENPNTLVWMVTMDGLWTSGFPHPPGTPTLEPYQHFTVLIDASTGGQEFVSANR